MGKLKRGDGGIFSGGSILRMSITALMIVIILFAAGVPMMMASVDRVNLSNLDYALDYWGDRGYVAYADPVGDLNVTGNLDVTGAVNADSINAPTGRTATYVVAASDALARVKAQADYVCDGTADDVEIQAAIDALTSGGTINLSSGTFNIATGLTANGNVIITGSGMDTTILSSSGLNTITFSDASVYGGGVSDLSINGAGASGTLITVNNVWKTFIKNCRFYSTSTNYETAISLTGTAYETEINNCRFTSFTVNAINSATNGTHVSNCDFAPNYGNTAITNSSAISIVNNWFETGPGQTGSHISSSGTAFIQGNVIGSTRNGGDQITITGGSATIIGNLISGSADNGIVISGALCFVTIEGNYFHHWGVKTPGSNAVKITSGSYITITGNDFYSIEGSAPGNVIASNTLLGNVVSNNFFSNTVDNIYAANSVSVFSNNHVNRMGGVYHCSVANGNFINTNISADGWGIYQARVTSGNYINGCAYGISAYHSVTGNYLSGCTNAIYCYVDGAIIADNFISGATTPITINNKTGLIISGNQGYIAPGEIRTYSVPYVAGNVDAIVASWHNPEAQDIYITKIVVKDTNDATLAATAAIGIADDAAGTNLGAEFFTAIPLDTAHPAVFDSWVAGDTGAQTKWIALQDSASATDGWINMIIADQNSDGTGTIYITYCGQ